MTAAVQRAQQGCWSQQMILEIQITKIIISPEINSINQS
jgi:hypothetical protein